MLVGRVANRVLSRLTAEGGPLCARPGAWRVPTLWPVQAAREFTDGDDALAAKVAALEDRYYQVIQVPPDSTAPGHTCAYGCFADNIYHSNISVGDVWVGNMTRSLAWCAMEAVVSSPSDPLHAYCSLGEGGAKGTTLAQVSHVFQKVT